jgi:hypothetical protein
MNDVVPQAEGELESQTKRLTKAHSEVLSALGKGCAASIDAGEALLRIKELVPFGKWMDYVEDNCRIPGRTARFYMELAKHKPQIEERLKAKGLSFANLGQSEAKRMISTLKPKAPGKAKRSRTIKFETLKNEWDKASDDVKRRFKQEIGLLTPPEVRRT